MVVGQSGNTVRAISLGLALAGLSLTGVSSAAEYNFAVEPTYTPERAREVYGPLMNYLNNSTGQTFNLVVARNYAFYWNDIRNRKDLHFVFCSFYQGNFNICVQLNNFERRHYSFDTAVYSCFLKTIGRTFIAGN